MISGVLKVGLFKGDPRPWFALLLGCCVFCGLSFFGFGRTPWQVALTVVTAVSADFLPDCLLRKRGGFPWSGLITGCGLALLLSRSRRGVTQNSGFSWVERDLFPSEQGTILTDITELAGISGHHTCLSALFIDADRDGDPDLALTLQFDPVLFYENHRKNPAASAVHFSFEVHTGTCMPSASARRF